MKKLMFLAFIVLLTAAMSAPAMAAGLDDLKTSFTGLKWGSSPKDLKNAVKVAEDDPEMDDAPPYASAYTVKDVDIAGIKADTVWYYYYKDQLMGARWQANDLEAMIDALTKAYGQPSAADQFGDQKNQSVDKADAVAWSVVLDPDASEIVVIMCDRATKYANIVNTKYLNEIMPEE